MRLSGSVQYTMTWTSVYFSLYYFTHPLIHSLTLKQIKTRPYLSYRTGNMKPKQSMTSAKDFWQLPFSQLQKPPLNKLKMMFAKSL